jgi:hypothetical protein
MEQTFREIITNDKIERVLEAFKSAVECTPRGICEPGGSHIAVSRRYVAFADKGEVRLERDGKQLFVEVRTDGCRLVTDAWDMFVLRCGGNAFISPRLAVGGKIFTTDEFIEFVRRGFRALLRTADWV